MELAMPAGSLQAALQAFSHGADAVYLGMKNFSARRGATNFSFEELSTLRRIADEEKKKIYVTVNTIITDSELCRAVSTLRAIAFIGCEGVIVQDLGVARLIRQDFPSLPLHASTQLAVHTIEGVKALQEMGFSRVVLSRELTLDEIEVIRKACPDVEIKVFIHGAECYGFSGLCMASSQICGRSANKGECAQICRTWFEAESDASVTPEFSPLPADKAKGWYFSMADLNGTGAVARLRDMGIDSLKVEGRMKNPTYVRATTRLYRALIDGTASPKLQKEMEEEVLTSFGRTNGGSWLASYGRPGAQPIDRQAGSVLTKGIPGHQGLPAGTIEDAIVDKGTIWLQIALSRGISLHDGLMYLVPTPTVPLQDIRFHVGTLLDRRKKRIIAADEGQSVFVAVNPDTATTLPSYGTVVSLVSAHDGTLPLLQENRPHAKRTLDMSVTISDRGITLAVQAQADFLPTLDIQQTFECTVQKARSPQDIHRNLMNVLEASDISYLTCGNLSITNTTSLDDADVFLPLSTLKDIRRAWYARLDQELVSWLEEIPAVESPTHAARPLDGAFVTLPERRLLAAQRTGYPWSQPEQVLQALKKGAAPEAVLPSCDGTFYFCLPPVLFEEQKTLTAADEVVARLVEGGFPLMVGLNNIGQVRWARRHPDIPTFADIYLYEGNRQAALALLEAAPTLVGGYHWVESATPPEEGLWPFPPSHAGSDFFPPLFISRGCFRHDALDLSCTGCPRTGSWYVSQTGKRYKVGVENCITVVTRAS